MTIERFFKNKAVINRTPGNRDRILQREKDTANTELRAAAALAGKKAFESFLDFSSRLVIPDRKAHRSPAGLARNVPIAAGNAMQNSKSVIGAFLKAAGRHADRKLLEYITK